MEPQTDDLIRVPPPGRTTLVDALDRVLEAGAVVTGDITLSVAEIDLVRVSLRAMVSAVETLERHASHHADAGLPPSPHAEAAPSAGSSVRRRQTPEDGAGSPDRRFREERRSADTVTGHPDAAPSAPIAHLGPRVDTDPERVERGLAQLVMTVVGLLKDLMERQAIRRVEAGTLTEEEVERLGTTFVRLEERFQEVLDHLGVRDEDLTLDLGPLGRLR